MPPKQFADGTYLSVTRARVRVVDVPALEQARVNHKPRHDGADAAGGAAQGIEP